MAAKNSQNRRWARPNEDERQRFLADVAAFYFHDGLTQSEIGRLIGVSTAMVSRFLAEARQKGIVQINIQYPFELDTDLQAELVKRFNLRTARVVVVGEEDSLRLRLKQVGQVTAQLIHTLLNDDSIITVGWGNTIYEVVNAMPPTTKKGIRVVQASGTLGGTASPTDNFHITQALAERLNGQSYHLHAPMIVSSREIRDSLYQEPSIAEVMALAQRADIMLKGLGVPYPEHSNMFKAGYLDAETLASFREEGSVGDLGAHNFDVYGVRCAVGLAERVIGISIEDSMNARHGILPAIGTFKSAAIVGALRTGGLNALVTDHITAQEVIKVGDQYPLPG